MVEALDGLGSPGCIVASFDEKGLQARLGEPERGEEAAQPALTTGRVPGGVEMCGTETLGSGETMRTRRRSRSGTRARIAFSSTPSANRMRTVSTMCTSDLRLASMERRRSSMWAK